MKKYEYDYLIVGAGLYGSVMAERLHSSGHKVVVVDKRDHVGGNCASKDMHGIDVHLYGPHILHTNNRDVWKYIIQFGEFRQFTHKMLTKYGDNFYTFPINAKTLLEVFGKDFTPHVPKVLKSNCNLEEWCINEIGEPLYNMFVKEYTEKQWNCKCSELPSSIIKRLPIRSNFNDSYFNNYYQGIPVDGYNTLFNKLLEGVDVKTGKDFLYFKKEWMEIAERVIYTGPIDAYFTYEFGRLPWRSLEFKFKEKQGKDYQGISVVHYPEKKYKFTRITEFKHFNPFNDAFDNDYTIYAEEYPCHNNDAPYYPIENEENIACVKKYQELAAKEKNVHFAGRLGTYKYNDMDVTIANALNDFSLLLEKWK